MKSYSYILKQLDCVECAKKIEDEIKKEDIFINVSVNFSTLKLKFDVEQDVQVEKIENKLRNIISKVEPDVHLLRDSINAKKGENIEENKNVKYTIIRILLGLILFIISLFFKSDSYTFLVLTFLAICLMIIKILQKAITKIIKNRIIDEDFLITISVFGAYIIGKPIEGLMVIFLYEFGKILETKAINKSRKSISTLMDIKPEFANVKKDNKLYTKFPNEVKIGDIIVVKSGERIPLDCTVISGNASIDNSALTGESKLLNIQTGDKVLSGSINVDGIIEARVDKLYVNSTVNRILELVENATDKKSKTENFVSQLARIYTPIVILLACLVAIFMPIILKDVTYSQSIYKALVFLVISCPCSIAISVPLSYFSGIGKASKNGILIKGSNYLDTLKDIGTIIFDKTGTLTTGKFTIDSINVLDESYDIETIKKYLVLGEHFSTHPIAKAILEELNSIKVDIKQVKDFKEIKGKGISFKYNLDNILIGNSNFVNKKERDDVNTVLYIKINEKVVGNVVLVDSLKDNAIESIDKLKSLKIITKMYTGDNNIVAESISKKLKLDDVKSQLLPIDKYNLLEQEIRSNNGKKRIAFVGDGINDSPVLARADVGISMGGIGASSSIEASDVVIMTDELNKIYDGIEISKFTNKIIIQNLVFSIMIKILTLILSLFGIADMWQAVFADVGVTLITIFNTLRILI